MKKLLLLIIPFLFTSCWIEPKIGDYVQNDNEWYFDNYVTMRSIMMPEINKTFSDWHWSSEAFDTKYNQYLNNTDLEDATKNKLNTSNYSYYARKGKSNKTMYYYNENHKKIDIANEYIFIMSNKDAVIFFQK